jgi:hypothetical protein
MDENNARNLGPAAPVEADSQNVSLLALEQEIQRLRGIIAAHLEACPSAGLPPERAGEPPGNTPRKATTALLTDVHARPLMGGRAPLAAPRPPARRRGRPANALVRAARAGLGALVSDLVDF